MCIMVFATNRLYDSCNTIIDITLKHCKEKVLDEELFRLIRSWWKNESDAATTIYKNRKYFFDEPIVSDDELPDFAPMIRRLEELKEQINTADTQWGKIYTYMDKVYIKMMDISVFLLEDYRRAAK